MRILLKIILITALLCLLISPHSSIFAQGDNFLDKEQIKKYLSIPENDNQQIMHTLIQLLNNELSDIISSTDRMPREDAIVATLMQSIKINALKFLLLDAPVEIVQKVVITSIRIAKIAYGITDLGDVVGLIERESAQNAVKYGFSALLKNDIRVTSGALNTNFVSYKNNPQELVFQYVIVLKPTSEKSWKIAINILSKDYFEPPMSTIGTQWRMSDWVAEGHTKIEPFIISIQGTMQKGQFDAYYWQGAPDIAISFPDSVPDLGFRPTSFLQRHLWQPIESQIREATVLLQKFIPSGPGIVNGLNDIWQSISQAGASVGNSFLEFFSSMGTSITDFVSNNPAPSNQPNGLAGQINLSALFNNPAPEQLTIAEPLANEITSQTNQPTPPQPASPDIDALARQLAALLEQIDNVSEEIDLLSSQQTPLETPLLTEQTPNNGLATNANASSSPISSSTPNTQSNTLANFQQPTHRAIIIPPAVQILISEVKTDSQNSATEEYIELYNPNNFAVKLDGFILRKKTASGASETVLISSSKFQGNIVAFGYFLITPQQYSSASYYISQTNDIFLYDKYDRLLDKAENVSHPRTHSFGRESQSAASAFEVQQPTPGYSNQKDTIAPQITILTKPNATTSTTTAEFSFTASKPDCVFEHQLDNNPFQKASGGQTPTLVKLKDLALGQHSFQIRAVDPVGNWANPWQYFWEIITPPNQPPTAAFSYSPTGEIFVNELAIFNAASSTDPDGAVVSYTWNFGAISATTTQSTTISHRFPATGQFQVTLVTSDDKGAASNPTTATVVVIPEPKILISEIQIESAFNTKDEFIELFNPNNFNIDLNGFALKKKTFSGAESNLVSPSRFTGIIATLGYFLITSPDNNTGNINYSGETYSIAKDNAILLYSGNDNLLDKVGFGLANDFEAAPALNPPKGYTIGRKWIADSQTYQDTDNNQDDFEMQIPTPSAKNEKDSTLPETEIIAKPPALTNQNQAIFSFSSNEDGSTFQCRLNNQDWQNCSSRFTYTNLSDGLFSFQVKAIDPASNEDQSPAQYAWTVDTSIASPLLSLADNSNSGLYTGSQTVKIEITQDQEATAWFLSENPEKPATDTPNWLNAKPLEFNLSAVDPSASSGQNKTVFIWTKDTADNISQLGNSASIVLDTIAPQTRVDQTPTNPTNQSQAAFAFSSNEAGASFLCKLDATNWLACASSTIFNGLNEGTRSLEVKALDLALNEDESPAQYNWLIDLTPPLSWIENMATSSTSTTVLVKWSGSDFGSGISEYDIQYKDNEGGEWQYLAQATSSLKASFTGENEHTYYFKSRARDIAGNEATWPENAEAFCKIEIPKPSKAILEVSTTTLFFYATQGAGNPASQNLIIKNSGQTEMAWSVATVANWNWVLLATTSGTLLANATTSVEITIDLARLDPGNYQATTTITADEAENSPQYAQINLVFEESPNQLPNANFTFSPNENLLVGDEITFNASSSTDDGEIIAFIWDFGDGSVATSHSPVISHIFNTADQFQILLIVQDDRGATSSPISTTLTIAVRPESRLLISEAQICGGPVCDSSTRDNDFVEIFNPNNQSIDISDFQLKKQTSSGTSTGYSLRVFPASSIIPANGYFLWANSDYIMPGLTPDATSTQTIASNNSIALFYSDHTTIIDQVAWGDSVNPFVETAPWTPNPANNQTITRRQNGSGNYLDTNNNAADFVLASSTPTNSLGQTIQPATSTPATSSPATTSPAYDPTAPVITDLQANPAADRQAIDLWWSNESNNNVNYYLINYDNQTIVFNTATTTNPTVYATTVAGLIGGQSYQFTAQAITSSGATSGPSNIATATPLLAFQDNNDGTVSDLYTGLMWPKNGASLAANNGQALTWFAAKDFCEQLVMCGNNEFTTTTDPVAACADKGGVKYDDWRLPNFKELALLIKYQKTPNDGAMIDSNYFQNIAGNKYWSASYKHFGPPDFGFEMWHARFVDFANGWIDYSDTRLDETYVPFVYNYVLPVRGNSAIVSPSGFDEPPTGCSAGYSVDADNLTTDLCTGLIESQRISFPELTGSNIEWWSAIREAALSTLAGYTDWRLPNIRELLMSINVGPSDSSFYWAITPDYQTSGQHWWADLGSRFSTGQSQTTLDRIPYYLKLFRGQ